MSKHSPEKAALFYTGKKTLKEFMAIPDVEEHFLNSQNFVTEKKFDFPYKTFRISTDGRFYCSPPIKNPVFKIHNLNEVKSASLTTAQGGSDALTGAVLFGAAGAVVGASSQKGFITIRIEMEKDFETVFFQTSDIPYKGNSKEYGEIMQNADKICRMLNENKATPENAQVDQEDFLSKLERLAALKEKGLLSDEEWTLAKEKLLR